MNPLFNIHRAEVLTKVNEMKFLVQESATSG